MNVFVATLLRLSYSGGFVILGVMILRLLLRGVPKQSRLIMWALAGLRLSVPLFVPSVFSIVPEPERLIADGGIIRQSSSFPTESYGSQAHSLRKHSFSPSFCFSCGYQEPWR